MLALFVLFACGGAPSEPSTLVDSGATDTALSTTPQTPTEPTTTPEPTGIRACTRSPEHYLASHFLVRDAGATDDGLRYTNPDVSPCLDIEVPPGDYEVSGDSTGCDSDWAPVTVTTGFAEVEVSLACYG
jgi:hypothetical protein